MISFDEFLKQDDEEKYNNMQHDLLEIKRLNNIINELEKYLIKQIDYTDGCDMFLDEQNEAYSNSLNKLQELKGSE